MQALPTPSRTESTPSRTQMLAWVVYDWGHSAFGTIVLTFVFAPYFTRRIAPSEDAGATFWGIGVGLAGLFVALGGPIAGAIADQGEKRKPWVGGFTALCAAATAALWFIRPDRSWLWAALAVVAVGRIGSDLAMIFYNAMLPDLAARERIGRWSAWGWSMGYLGGLACLVAVLFVFVSDNAPLLSLDRGTGQHIRLAMLFTAGWLVLFALPLLLITPDRPPSGKSATHIVGDGLRQLRDSFHLLRDHCGILRFLVARMIYADGLATTFVMGGVFASNVFNMTEQQVLLFGISLNVSAGLGAGVFAWFDDRLGGKRSIIFSLTGIVAPGIFMLLATSVAAFWVWGLLLGLFVGPIQSASRSYLSRVAPEDLRTEFFGLYALSGKATAFVGPILVGWLTALTGSQRAGMSTIIVFFVTGLAIVLTLPASRPGEEA